VLSALQHRVTAVVADLLATRPGLSVVEAGAPPGVLALGAGVVQVAVASVLPPAEDDFAAGRVLPPASSSQRVRVVRVDALVRTTFARRAGDAGDAALRQARSALLDDVTLVVHGLDDAAARSGGTFAGDDADPGFRVLGLSLASVDLPADPTSDIQHAAAAYTADVLVWLPGTGGILDRIPAVDMVLEPLPLTVTAAPRTVVPGGTARITVEGVAGSRLVDVATRAREALSLAVGVRSTRPPAQRGVISDGVAATVAGFRVVAVTAPRTVVTYTAATDGGPGHEDVVVHLAGPGGTVGLALAAVTLQLAAPPP
jgi:hypothetical protein